MSARLPGVKCPDCGAVIRGEIIVQGDDQTQPGDIAVCAHCLSVCVLTDALELRAATKEELNRCSAGTLVAIVHAQQSCLRMRQLLASRN
jgi:hypothetical protein